MSHPKQAARSKREVRMCVCVRSFVVCLSCAFPPKSNAGGGRAHRPPPEREREGRRAGLGGSCLLAWLSIDAREGDAQQAQSPCVWHG